MRRPQTHRQLIAEAERIFADVGPGYSLGRQRARNRFRCAACGRPIARGQRFWRQSERDGVHLRCQREGLIDAARTPAVA